MNGRERERERGGVIFLHSEYAIGFNGKLHEYSLVVAQYFQDKC